MLTLVVMSAWAAPCDFPIFSTLSAPSVDDAGHGVSTGESSLDGAPAVGGRFAYRSTAPTSAWISVLEAADTQDEWVPRRFGYERAERIDASHMYLLIDIGLVWGKLHVRRQLVVATEDGLVGDTFRSCWRMVDAGPFASRIAAWVQPDVEWEKASVGWWEVHADGTGTTVGYQWWTQVGQIPAGIQTWGMRNTIPDLIAAFDARAADVAAGRVK